MNIGELARRVAVRPSAIRYYEKRGLLKRPARLPNQYRVYDDRDVRTLRFMRRAQVYGMALSEIIQVLELDRAGMMPCQRTRRIAKEHVKQIEIQIRELGSLKKALQSLVKRRPARRGHAVCSLIES